MNDHFAGMSELIGMTGISGMTGITGISVMTEMSEVSGKPGWYQSRVSIRITPRNIK